MKCPKCEEVDNKVMESRDIGDASAIRRRRECNKCSHRYTTYERIERPQLVVVKKDKSRELFDRKKIMSGLARATEKRPVTQMQLEALIADLERSIYEKGDPEIQSQEVGEMVMERLLGLDDVAYVRFASVYRSFKDIASFERELKRIKNK